MHKLLDELRSSTLRNLLKTEKLFEIQSLHLAAISARIHLTKMAWMAPSLTLYLVSTNVICF